MRTPASTRPTRTAARQPGSLRPLRHVVPVGKSCGSGVRHVSAANASAVRPEALGELLSARRLELLASLRSGPAALAGLGRVAEDDQAPVIHGQFISARISQISQEQLGLVETALARMDSGEYGICLECEQPIAARRLAAVPWASRCIACQERLDSVRHASEETQT